MRPVQQDEDGGLKGRGNDPPFQDHTTTHQKENGTMREYRIIRETDDGFSVLASRRTRTTARAYAERYAASVGGEVVEDQDGDFVVVLKGRAD